MAGIKRVLIVGGGFGGIRAALDLDRARLPNVRVTLITNRPHFEYHPALYRLVAGRTPLEVCIPLKEIFAGTYVEWIVDEMIRIDFNARRVYGKSGADYKYDFLILALGSETSFLNIPGLARLSYGFKSITQALRLKEHLHEALQRSGKLVVAGGGPSGIEIAGELAQYIKKLARQHKLERSLPTIDLIEAGPRLAPALPEAFAGRIGRRLRRLGVTIHLNQPVLGEDIEQIYLDDREFKTKTVIWTAGVKPHHFFDSLAHLPKDRHGRMIVNEYLEIQKQPGVFVIGDSAATPYSGMAQTAIYDGRYVANLIKNRLLSGVLAPYKPSKPFYAIPVGPRWAAVMIGPLRFYGRFGWILRRLADLRFFLTILPWRKALRAFRNEKTLCETCAICLPETRPADAKSA